MLFVFVHTQKYSIINNKWNEHLGAYTNDESASGNGLWVKNNIVMLTPNLRATSWSIDRVRSSHPARWNPSKNLSFYWFNSITQRLSTVVSKSLASTQVVLVTQLSTAIRSFSSHQCCANHGCSQPVAGIYRCRNNMSLWEGGGSGREARVWTLSSN